MEYEYVYIDPILGRVSCESDYDAMRYARLYNVEAWRVHWVDGEETGYDVIARPR